MATRRPTGTDSKQRPSMNSTTTNNENEVYNIQQHKQESLFDRLHMLDVEISRKLSVCAGKDDGWRSFLIVLEISGHGIPWITGLVFAIYKLRDHQQQYALNVLIAMFLDLAIVGLLKVLFRRQRPVYNQQDMFVTVSVDNYSFPSGHSTRAAMVAALFSLITSKPLYRLVASVWAIGIALSRVVLGRHHVSDVVFGVMIGLLQYWIVIYLWLPLDTCHKLLELIPYMDIVQ